MKKRTYRAKPVKSVDLEKLGAELKDTERVVFAIDVAKEVMFAALKIEAEAVYTTLKWHHLKESLMVVKWAAGLAGVEVAMEPSGTYGDSLRWHLERRGVAVYRTSPKLVKDSREIYDGVPSTHDAKAAAIVGWLHWQGRSELWSERHKVDRELVAAVRTMWLYQQPYLQCQNRLEAQLARYWPELTTYLALNSATLLELLKTFVSPAAVAGSPQLACALMARVGGSALKPETIEAVVSSSRSTLGVPMLIAEREALQELATEARRLQIAARQAKSKIEALTLADPLLERLAPVVGKLTAAVVTVSAGRVTDYSNAHRWEKALGLNLKIRSSGKYQGQLKITKRGPSISRQFLYLATLRLIKDDPGVNAWYEAKVKRDGGKVKLKAVIAVMRKLARALWWVGQGEAFEAKKLFDARRLPNT